MKEGWRQRLIGDVCDLATGGTPSRSKPEYFGGEIKWLVSGDIHKGEIHDCEGRITDAGMKSCNTKLLPTNSVMIALNGQGKTRGTVAMLRTPATCNQSLVCITPKPSVELMPEFLYANLHSRYEAIRRVTSDDDNDRRGLNMGLIRSIQIPIAPLPEQQRLVTLFDKAFASITAATANLERNRQNASELFESLVHGIRAAPVPLGELVRIATGKLDANEAVEGGQYPFFTCSRDVYAIDRYAFDCEAILLAGNNAVGDFNVKHYKGRFNAYQRTYVITVTAPHRVLYRFLYFQMLRGLKKFKSQSVGAGTKFLKMDMIKNLPIALPSPKEQERIVAMMDGVREETEKLQSIYRRKGEALAALKSSLLHQAFTGQL